MEKLPKRNLPKELEEIKRMRAERAAKLREQFLKETEEGVSKVVTKEELEAQQKAVEKQRMRKPEPQL